MSISEQVKHLKELSDTAKENVYSFEALSQSLKEAADTIESLSAKLADIERSAEDCGNGWISDRGPKESGNYFITTDTVVMGEVDSDVAYWDGESWNTFADVYAWKPIKFPEPYLLEPYHEP